MTDCHDEPTANLDKKLKALGKLCLILKDIKAYTWDLKFEGRSVPAASAKFIADMAKKSPVQ